MLKPVFKIAMACCVFACLVFILQLGYFFHVLISRDTVEQADAIVVFTGGPKRVAQGYRLANAGRADTLVISSATKGAVNLFGKKFPLREGVRLLTEGKSKTTFENAYFTKRIVGTHHLKSIILVTATYHMPRSYFLLRLFCMDSDVKVYRYPVAASGTAPEGWAARLKDGLVFREMVKFWGSLMQFLSYKVGGALPGDGPL